jgi:hypothetical protein
MAGIVIASRSSALRLVLVAVAALSPIGCPGTLDDPERFSEAESAPCPSGYDVEKDLFQSTCAASNCHDSSQPAGDLDLGSPNVASRLLGVAASDPKCASRLLVDEDNPTQSFILEKLVKSNPQCGVQMPNGSKPLAPAQVQCVRDWITARLGGGDASVDATPEASSDAAADASSDAANDAASDTGGD